MWSCILVLPVPPFAPSDSLLGYGLQVISGENERETERDQRAEAGEAGIPSFRVNPTQKVPGRGGCEGV